MVTVVDSLFVKSQPSLRKFTYQTKDNTVLGVSNITPVLQYSITPTRNCMDLLSTYHLKQWVEANKDYFNPPFRTNRLLVHHKDFLVMILRGPNTRLDFHIEPGDEFFYQVEGAMELHLKAPGERRQVVEIKEGEIFVCPGGLAHSPRRFENTWGLVIERKRRPEEKKKSSPGSAKSAMS
mgnify:CR=1 FL=1